MNDEIKNIDERLNGIALPEHQQLELDLLNPRAVGLQERLESVEPLFEPVTAENAGLHGLALVTLPQGTLRLTSKGRDFYRQSCELMELAPRQIRTLAQLQTLRRIDAELMLQRLMDVELIAMGA